MTIEKQRITKKLATKHPAVRAIPASDLYRMSGLEDFDDSITGFHPSRHESYFSSQTTEVMDKVRELKEVTLSSSENYYRNDATLDERLFDARAAVKIIFSQASMHFNEALREKLFRQFDLLHDIDDWEDEDEPIRAQSFKTFLRWFYLNMPTRLPNFGLSATGQFIATWLTNENKDKLILEFFSKDRIRWFVTKHYDDENDHSSGSTKLSRISDVLAPYHTVDWFNSES